MALLSRKIQATFTTVWAIRTHHSNRSQTCRVWTSQNLRLLTTNLRPTCKQLTRASLPLLMLWTWTIWVQWSPSTWLPHWMCSPINSLSHQREIEMLDSPKVASTNIHNNNKCSIVPVSNHKEAAIASSRACLMNRGSKRYCRDCSMRGRCAVDLSKRAEVYSQTSITTEVGRNKPLSLSNQEPLTCNNSRARGRLNSKMSLKCLHSNKCPGRTWSARC